MSMFLRYFTYELGIFHINRTIKNMLNKMVAPVFSFASLPKAAILFWLFFVICYVLFVAMSFALSVIYIYL